MNVGEPLLGGHATFVDHVRIYGFADPQSVRVLLNRTMLAEGFEFGAVAARCFVNDELALGLIAEVRTEDFKFHV
jgi:hypothetical protein